VARYGLEGRKECSVDARGASHPVRVVVDSSTCIERALADELGITLVPLHLHLDGRDLRDLEDVTPAEVYKALREGVRITTSSASVGEYLEAFRGGSGPVFCPTVAANMSAMHEAATIAAGMVEGTEVRVIDSGTAAGGLRLIALAAARMAAQGMSLDEIEARARGIGGRMEVVGMLDTVDYLARSGRIPQVAAWGSSVLKVRPVVRFRSGSGSLITLVRGNGWALRELSKLVRDGARRQTAGEGGEGLVCTVFHADAAELACDLLDRLREALPGAELSLSEFTPVMGVHTGPGLVGYALYVDPTE
jgi:fatty acid kinase fatty acid binding subunit